MKKYLIGLDFGSDSVRGVLTDRAGSVLASAVFAYPRWAQKLYCDPAVSQYRQHPLDYFEGIEFVIKDLVRQSSVSPAEIAAIALDATASTPVAVDERGQVLALSEEFADDPDGMFILWKDHTAVPEALQINEAAGDWSKKHGIDYRTYCGGIYAEEWFWSKILHILKVNPRVREKAADFVECVDYLSCELADCLAPEKLVRCRCGAGHKAMWNIQWGGLPPVEFFDSIDPLLGEARRKVRNFEVTPTAGEVLGNLSQKWCRILGLPNDVIVAVGSVDGHTCAVGAGVKPGRLARVFGTSGCDMIITPPLPKPVPGICGEADGSIIPGYIGLEAGQSSFGDLFAWLKRILEFGGGTVDLSALEAEAKKIPVDRVICPALDWFGGKRTPYAQPQLRGMFGNLGLETTAVDIYYSLLQGAACGMRAIIEHFDACGVKIDDVVGVGGIARKSPLLMQLCANHIKRPLHIAAGAEHGARGSALYAGVAAGFYASVEAAVNEALPEPDMSYYPDPAAAEAVDQSYQLYCQLADSAEKIQL